MFNNHFPDIIEIILIYIQNPQEKLQKSAQEINKNLLNLVLTIIKDKDDYNAILNKLKSEFKENKIVKSNQG